MKIRILILLLLPFTGFAFQTASLSDDNYSFSDELKAAIQADDVAQIAANLEPMEINNCMGKYSLLVLSIKLNAINSLKYLMKQGADLEVACDGRTPLIHAALDNKLNFLRALVDHGADLKSTYKGRTAIDYALHAGHEDIITYFKIEKGFELYKLNGIDGPYVIGDSLYNVNADNQIVRKKISPTAPILVKVNNEDQDQFEVKRKEAHNVEETIYKMPKKLLAISDIEGNFDGYYSFLLNNKVIDKDYNWTYGDGHLVLVGDFVDRGEQVTPVLWLTYSLEEKAKKHGGAVHFILGNHEVMNIQGDTRYVQDKYISLAQNVSNNPAWDEAYLHMFSTDSELGKWMRSKNSVEKIGDYIFVHAGLSPRLLELKISLSKINKTIRDNIDLDVYKTPSTSTTVNFIMANQGPLWYRGLVTRNGNYEKATPKEVKSLLKYFRAKKIVIGHTLTDHIQSSFDGQVIMIDIKHMHKKNSGGTKGLLVEDGVEYVVDDLGKKAKL